MDSPTRSTGASMLLLLLASQAQTGYSRPSLDGEGAQALSRRHMMADNELVHPLSMQPGTDDWEKHAQADFLLDLPSWEDEQGEVHPLDSPELRGPFEYSETEERELAKNLAVDDSEWNASSGGIGGRPRPRYCVLDKAWRASKHPRMDFSSSGFRKMLRAALKEKRLHDLLVNDRYQEARGHDVLTGELLTMDILSSYSCPVLRTYAEADWSCAMKTQGHQRNGLLKFDKPFKDVRSMRLTASSILEPPEDISNFDEIFFERGPSFQQCREGSCDCDKVFDDHDGHFPAICNVRNLLRELEPYQEEHARQQITVAFSLFDKPWFTTTNESIYDSSGMIAVESELPAQMVQSNWFGRIFYEGKHDRLPGIDTYPKMFSSAYMEGREQLLVETILNADLESKRGVLAAWGQRHGKTARSDASAALNDFAARYDWVEHRMIPADHYWPELAKYRFLMAPRGNGLQAPKFMEALALMTIPITKRYACFEDLQMYGFPLVIVDDWDEITPKALEYWWEKLSPRLEEARWLVTHYGLNSLLYGDCD